MSRTIFITGVTGFLGRHFLKIASKHDWKLVCLVRKSPSLNSGVNFKGASSNKRNLHPNVEWVYGDLLKKGSWVKKLRHCDTLIHLAVCPLPLCEKDPMLGCRLIVEGLKNLLEQVQKNGIRRVILASTSEVYGSPSRLPIRETAPLQPLSFYGFFKACADFYALTLAEQRSFSLCILRFFNLYGRTIDGNLPPTVLRLFAEQILQKKPVVLHASYRNSRDFIHVKDAARAISLAVQNEKAEGIFNIGSGKETSLRSAAKQLALLAGKELKIDFRPKEGRLRRLAADCGPAKSILKFTPKVSLEQGLREVIEAVASTLKS